MNLDEEQVYNADKSAAFWRVLPGTTWEMKNLPLAEKYPKIALLLCLVPMPQERITCRFWLSASQPIRDHLKILIFQQYAKLLRKVNIHFFGLVLKGFYSQSENNFDGCKQTSEGTFGFGQRPISLKRRRNKF